MAIIIENLIKLTFNGLMMAIKQKIKMLRARTIRFYRYNIYPRTKYIFFKYKTHGYLFCLNSTF
jgi:hypothetical protein